jgi:hypothetical protein
MRLLAGADMNRSSSLRGQDTFMQDPNSSAFDNGVPDLYGSSGGDDSPFGAGSSSSSRRNNGMFGGGFKGKPRDEDHDESCSDESDTDDGDDDGAGDSTVDTRSSNGCE